MDRKKICFNGCSVTFGEGFDEHIRDLYIYDRLVAKELGFYRTNIAVPGSSNHEIFMRSASALKSDFDVVITQWASLNRIWFRPGPDTTFTITPTTDQDYRYREIDLSGKQRRFFVDTVMMMNHDYYNIFSIIDYCSILDRLALQSNKKILYINGWLPWTDDLIKTLDTDLDRFLSAYSKELLDFEHRDDQEVIGFFLSLQEKFQELDRSKWINLFDSFESITVDLGPQGHHPGIQSHGKMAAKVIDHLQQRRILD